MDYYQGVVLEYIRADRSVFVNAECCVQLNDRDNPDSSGPHWYCDALAVDFSGPAVYLCETSYSQSLGALLKRLKDWSTHWPEVQSSIVRDCRLPAGWPMRPWLFIPEECAKSAVSAIERIRGGGESGRVLPLPRITTLEMVAPWKYRSWRRVGETTKPDSIPEGMRI
jgi:hypothetical protein